MTTVVECIVKCALCEVGATIPVLLSNSSFGPPDLDLRPASPAREAVELMIQSCDNCGYACRDISQARPDAAAVVASDDYKKLQADRAIPASARAYLCSALLEHARGRHDLAARESLAAAWVCDDADAHVAAVTCRLKAIDHMRAARDLDQRITPQPATEWLLIADIFRRAMLFDEDAAACAQSRSHDADGSLAPIIELEERHIRARDADRHTIGETSQSRLRQR